MSRTSPPDDAPVDIASAKLRRKKRKAAEFYLQNHGLRGEVQGDVIAMPLDDFLSVLRIQIETEQRMAKLVRALKRSMPAFAAFDDVVRWLDSAPTSIDPDPTKKL